MSNNSTSSGTYLSTSEGGITPASVIAVGAVLSGLAAIAVILRFYVRICRSHTSPSVEDWLILASFILTLGLGLILIVGMSSVRYYHSSVILML
jgi:ABC-type nickel/cobalt efflux system permease component RcnA